MGESMVAIASRALPHASRRGRYFFFGAALVVVATVIAGFSPTFFLRGYVVAPVPPPWPLPLYMIAHGCAMTVWCLFYAWQTWLAASGRTATHRRTGWLGCGIFALAIVTALYTTLSIVRFRIAAGFPADVAAESPMRIVLFTNLASLPWLVVLFTAAVLLRTRREWHGRLMYWTFVFNMGPALGGGGTRLLEPLIQPYVAVPALAVLPVALIALLVHDFRARGRPHMATFVGAVVNFIAPLPGVVFALSPAGREAFLAFG
jgi:hypothetical protein